MSFDASDYCQCEVYNSTERKARKAHKCSACREEIKPGHKYFDIRMIADGYVDTVKRCQRCQKIYQHLRGKIGCGEDVDEWLNCGHEYEDAHGEKPPEEIAKLAFILPDEMQAG